jgi:hypothetical protein
MTYRLTTWLVTLALFAGTGSAADDPKPDQPEPPVRLKKKDKPKAEPLPDKKPEPPKDEAKKKDGAKDDEPGDVKEQGEDPKVTLERLQKNMKDSADRLAKPDPSEGTRQVQRDILTDLDKLIDQMKQQQQSNASNSSSAQQQDDKQGGSGKRTMVRRRMSSRRQARGQQDKPRDSRPDQPLSRAGGGGKGAQDKNDKRPVPYKDIWGHLPESLRMQMDQYAREKFMAKYDDLLKQYYATIAEKGNR